MFRIYALELSWTNWKTIIVLGTNVLFFIIGSISVVLSV